MLLFEAATSQPHKMYFSYEVSKEFYLGLDLGYAEKPYFVKNKQGLIIPKCLWISSRYDPDTNGVILWWDKLVPNNDDIRTEFVRSELPLKQLQFLARIVIGYSDSF